LFQLGRSFTSGKLRSGMNRPAPDCWLPRSHRAHRAACYPLRSRPRTLGRSAARQQEEPDTQPRWKNSRHGRLHADERPRDAAVDVPCIGDSSIRSPEESAENSRRIPKTWTLPLKGPHGTNQVQSRLDSLQRRGGGHCRRFVTATRPRQPVHERRLPGRNPNLGIISSLASWPQPSGRLRNRRQLARRLTDVVNPGSIVFAGGRAVPALRQHLGRVRH
jgi:hypothetical protein